MNLKNEVFLLRFILLISFGYALKINDELMNDNSNISMLQKNTVLLNNMKSTFKNQILSKMLSGPKIPGPTAGKKPAQKPKAKKPSGKKGGKSKGKKILTYYRIIGVNKKVPTIGVLCGPQPNDALFGIKQAKCDHHTIHWLYQSGAEIVPILPWTKKKQLNIILSKIHGVVFPSGLRFLGVKEPLKFQYEKFANNLFNRLKELNKKGVYTPLFGIGQGFQLMQVLVAKTGSILRPSKGTNNIMLPQFVWQNPKNHKMFSLFDKSDLFNFKFRRTTANFHKFCVLAKTYKKNSLIKQFYKIISYGVEETGNIFVSGIEAYSFPFYGTQFHPELLTWDRKKSNKIILSTEAIRISQKLGNFFIQECRKNPNPQVKTKEYSKLGKINLPSRNLIPRKENHYWFYNSGKAKLKKGEILPDWRNQNKVNKPKPKPKPKKKGPPIKLPPDTKKPEKESNSKGSNIVTPPPPKKNVKKKA